VIILHYFQYSQLLHEYPALEYTRNANINIAWLVNRGYLVFTPDTWFRSGRPRPASAWNTVEGAALNLKGLPYVDGNKLGVMGHSRGGGYTNYIITHSTKFAAVFEGAGSSDWVSDQLTLGPDGIARNSNHVTDPDIYRRFMKDNPILHIDKITSPLLIFHNREDGAVPWPQAVELYLSMRRLGKKVWMLQYDKEHHSVMQHKNRIDLTLRATQFFDHYLKGAPAPVWMTRGIKATLKGIETGYEFDNSDRKP
jgi:dipeptidyl aminopeptidase/acylaminoacyl peptidase